MSRKGAPTFSSLLKDCVLWAPLSGSSVTTTGKTITANGNATQSTAVLDPWGLARPVGYFDGSEDYLTFANTTSGFIDFTNPMTIEFRVKLNVKDVTSAVLCVDGYVGNHAGHLITITNGNLIFVHIRPDSSPSSGNVVTGLSSSTVLDTGIWYHVAVTVSSNVGKLYVNGNLEATVTYSENAEPPLNAVNTYIGQYYNGMYPLNGYLSEFRVSNTVRYTTTFTPSTTRFKPDINTKLLLHMYGTGATFVDDPFIDVDEFPIIPSGVTVTNNGTFTKTDLGNNKSVLNFDGSTNRITFSDSASFTLGTNAFSLVMWVNLSSVNTIHTLCHLFAATNSGLELYTSASAKLCLKVSDTSTAGNMVDATGSSTLEASTWYHIAVTRSGSTFTVYLNATSDSTGSSAASIIDPTTIAIGCRPTGTPDQYHYGTIKDVMLINGKALSLPEIKLLMNRTHPITGAGLMPANGDYWRTS